jgi:hypothetical protein
MSETTRDAYEYAANHGLEVIESDDKHLQLDIDVPFGDKPPMSEERNAAWALLYRDFAPDMEDRVLYVRSPGGNTHGYVKLAVDQPLPHDVRVALQAILGSDPKREILNLLRIHGPNPGRIGEQTVMFETPETAEVVREWLKSGTRPGSAHKIELELPEDDLAF